MEAPMAFRGREREREGESKSGEREGEKKHTRTTVVVVVVLEVRAPSVPESHNHKSEEETRAHIGCTGQAARASSLPCLLYGARELFRVWMQSHRPSEGDGKQRELVIMGLKITAVATFCTLAGIYRLFLRARKL